MNGSPGTFGMKVAWKNLKPGLQCYIIWIKIYWIFKAFEYFGAKVLNYFKRKHFDIFWTKILNTLKTKYLTFKELKHINNL